MKYANYIHVCVQILLVGKRHRHVHAADAQLCLRHTAIKQHTKQRAVPLFCQPKC